MVSVRVIQKIKINLKKFHRFVKLDDKTGCGREQKEI